MQALGIKHVADGTRVLDLVRSVVSGNGLPTAVDITTGGHDDQPSTWSIEQFYAHARKGALADVADKLKEHRFAGDVIATISLECVAGLLGLTMNQEVAFFDVIEALRSRLSSG